MIGQDNTDHGPHEQKQQGEKPAGRIILRQIVVGIKDDQQADTQNQQNKQGGQAVHPQDEIKTGLGQPRPTHRHRRPGKGGQQRLQRQQQGGSRHECRRPCRRPSPKRSRTERQQGPGKGQQNNEQQIHSLVNPSRIVRSAPQPRQAEAPAGNSTDNHRPEAQLIPPEPGPISVPSRYGILSFL